MIKKIGIFTCGQIDHLPSWDPDSIHQGIGGSEEAVIYMAKQLAAHYQVVVFGDPPPHSIHSREGANPRYLPLKPVCTELLDVAISWRMPDVAPFLKSFARTVYLWPHDVNYYSMSQQEVEAWDGVLWLSKWQRAQWCERNPGLARFETIFGNGVQAECFDSLSLKKENPYSCIYASNYGRGLSVLLKLWPSIKQQFPQATLDIYYGMKHWARMLQDESSSMQQKIDELSHLDVREHGLVSHERLNQAYARTSLWTYPCTFPEVFCISALRAQLGGCVPVIIPQSALFETVRSGCLCNHPENYQAVLVHAMSKVDLITEEERRNMGEFIRREYTWKHIAQRWMALFESNSVGE